MITKGIVEKIEDSNLVRVRLPILNGVKGYKKATPTENLSLATLCVLPNSYNNVQEGDIVFVGFEDNDLGRPVILGHLFKENLSKTNVDLSLRKLDVLSIARLPENTSIGDIDATNIKCLYGVKDNIQKQIDELYNIINNKGV